MKENNITRVEAHELRIGNWVYVVKVCPVVITPDHIKSIFEGDIDYTPIPLSPEILEKAGFERCSCGGYKNSIHISKDDKGRIYYRGATLKYLHQLQNLYFSLVGEELTIQL